MGEHYSTPFADILLLAPVFVHLISTTPNMLILSLGHKKVRDLEVGKVFIPQDREYREMAHHFPIFAV